MAKRYFQRNTQDHPASAGQHDLKLSTGSAGELSYNIPAQTFGMFTAQFTTSPNEPNAAAWNGEFKGQYHVLAAGADVTFIPAFVRTNSAGSPAQAASTDTLSGAGLYEFTAVLNWPNAVTSDRFQVRLNATNANMMSAQAITLQVNTADSYAEGPWQDGGEEPPPPPPGHIGEAALVTPLSTVTAEGSHETPTVEFLYAAAHIEGDWANPENTIGNTPGTWAGEVNAAENATGRWAMAAPAHPLTPGEPQTIRVLIRRGTNNGIPSISLNLYQGGVFVQELMADEPVNSTEGEVRAVTFPAGVITNRNNVEIEAVAIAAGGNPSTRNSVQLAYIEWEADTTEGEELPPDVFGTAELITPLSTVTAEGSSVVPVTEGQAHLVTPLSTIQAAGTMGAPSFEGQAALVTPLSTLTATGERTIPERVGEAALTTPLSVVQATGEHEAPVVEGAAALITPLSTIQAAGTFGGVEVSGEAHLTTPLSTLAAEGSFGIAERTGEAALVAPLSTLQATGEHQAPEATGDAHLVTPLSTVQATGVFGVPAFTGDAALVTPLSTVNAEGEHEAPEVTGQAQLVTPLSTVAATGTFTEGYKKTGPAVINPTLTVVRGEGLIRTTLERALSKQDRAGSLARASPNSQLERTGLSVTLALSTPETTFARQDHAGEIVVLPGGSLERVEPVVLERRTVAVIVARQDHAGTLARNTPESAVERRKDAPLMERTTNQHDLGRVTPAPDLTREL